MSEHAQHRLGRPRPPFVPRTIQCVSCGSPQTVADERAVQLICGACGAALELSGTEATLLRQGTRGGYNFPLALDAPFRWKGHRWRVTARLALTEDDDPGGVTRVYYLYSPRRGPLYLDEYQGRWCLSWDTHVQPLAPPFDLDTGDALETGDGRRWITTDGGTYRVAWVDGALPWTQQAGDRIRYVELRATDGSEDLLDAEGQGTEVEMGLGRMLSPEEVRSATGNPKLPALEPERPGVLARAADRMPLTELLLLSLGGLALNGVLYLSQGSSGRVILEERLDEDRLTGETLTRPFTLDRPDTVVAVHVAAPGLDNAWMAVDFALVGADELVVHVDDVDLEYYHGTEGGESWSEGSSAERTLFRVPEAGTYRLLVHAVSNAGETESASIAMHEAVLTVREGARPQSWAAFGAIANAIVGLFLLIARKAQSGWEDDDD